MLEQRPNVFSFKHNRDATEEKGPFNENVDKACHCDH